MKRYSFQSPSPVRIFIATDVTMAELATALTGTLLTFSTRPGVGIMIHRRRLGIDNARPLIPCDTPPGPEAA